MVSPGKALVALLSVGLLLAACGGEKRSSASAFDDDSKLAVAASFLPLAEAASAIGGDRVQVLNLTPVGSSPHAVELGGRIVADLERADLVFYLAGGFQPAVAKAVGGLGEGERAVDLLPKELLAVDAALPGVEGEVDGEVLTGGVDPHVWLDPSRFKAMVQRMAAALVQTDPAGKAQYETNAATYTGALDALDAQFRAGLSGCDSRIIVTSHRAFGYLADRYELVQVPIAGIAPEEEPNPRSMAAVAAFAKSRGVEVVFFESLVPKKLADAVASEIGARTDALDPIEGLTAEQVEEGRSYVSIQQDNLASLRRGLGCTGG